VDLHRIEEGLAADVAVEAYPNLVLGGRVEHVGSLAAGNRGSPWKFFSVRLSLDQTDPRLRPGMSVRVSFLLDSARDVILAPLDAVFTRGQETVCYVRRGGDVWEQPITLGKRNDTHVEIRSGIAAGEELLLAAPESSIRRAAREEPHA
jgi:multidrug efflux pump subunit AcrA (membrane-fusion protein)